MANISLLEPGEIALCKQLENGRIVQISLTVEQYTVLKVVLASLSKETSFIQMPEEHDFVLKSSITSTLRIGSIHDDIYLEENYSDDSEILSVIYYKKIYFIFITNNPKGCFRFDDGMDMHYSNNYHEIFSVMTKYISDNG